MLGSSVGACLAKEDPRRRKRLASKHLLWKSAIRKTVLNEVPFPLATLLPHHGLGSLDKRLCVSDFSWFDLSRETVTIREERAINMP